MCKLKKLILFFPLTLLSTAAFGEKVFSKKSNTQCTHYQNFIDFHDYIETKKLTQSKDKALNLASDLVLNCEAKLEDFKLVESSLQSWELPAGFATDLTIKLFLVQDLEIRKLIQMVKGPKPRFIMDLTGTELFTFLSSSAQILSAISGADKSSEYLTLSQIIWDQSSEFHGKDRKKRIQFLMNVMSSFSRYENSSMLSDYKKLNELLIKSTLINKKRIESFGLLLTILTKGPKATSDFINLQSYFQSSSIGLSADKSIEKALQITNKLF